MFNFIPMVDEIIFARCQQHGEKFAHAILFPVEGVFYRLLINHSMATCRTVVVAHGTTKVNGPMVNDQEVVYHWVVAVT